MFNIINHHIPIWQCWPRPQKLQVDWTVWWPGEMLRAVFTELDVGSCQALLHDRCNNRAREYLKTNPNIYQLPACRCSMCVFSNRNRKNEMIGQFWTPSKHVTAWLCPTFTMLKRLDPPSLGSIHQLENVTVSPCLWKTKYGWYSATSAVQQTGSNFQHFSTSLMYLSLVGGWIPTHLEKYAKVKLDHEIPKESGWKMSRKNRDLDATCRATVPRRSVPKPSQASWSQAGQVKQGDMVGYLLILWMWWAALKPWQLCDQV